MLISLVDYPLRYF